jgi:ubiquinone biosynthesis monooxygenase Coq7
MLTAFARSHLKTEQQHLKYFETWLSSTDKSVLTPLWRIAGWLLGSLACLGGAPVVYLTIETVETFVIDHYQQQILKLEQQQQYPEGRRVTSPIHVRRAPSLPGCGSST